MNRSPLLLVAPLLLALAPAPAKAEVLTAPTAFELTGAHVTRGPFAARVEVTPSWPDVLWVVRTVRWADGSQEVQAALGRQRPFLVEASFPAHAGLAGRLGGVGREPPLELALEHDGRGRCRSRTSRAGEQRSEARGAAPGVETRLDVAIISDLNGEYGSAEYGRPVRNAVRAIIDRLRPDLVLATGDMVAGQLQGWQEPERRDGLERTCRAMWRAFHGAVTDPLRAAGIPLAPAPGNHDASAWRPYERRIYAQAWQGLVDVELVDGRDFPFRYSFVRGGVFFLALDATRAGRLEHEGWVREQLASPRAQACPVKIAFGHFPIHPTAEQRRTAILHGSLEQTFAELGLSLYAAGHHHAYYPGASGGVRQVVMACLGGGRRPLIGQTQRSPHSLVLVQVRGGQLTALEAFTGDALDVPVERRRLPARLGALTRDDRAGFPSTWSPAPAGP